MTQLFRITALVRWLVVLLVPMVAVADTTHIVPGMVIEALAARGVNLTRDEVSLPLLVPARSAQPQLEIISARPLGNARTRVLLRCQAIGDCVPFYAVLAWHPESKSLSSLSSPHSSGTARANSKSAEPYPWMVRTGQAATLVLESGHVRIEMPVICLTNGRQGSRVRVTTPDRKRVYSAEVLAAGKVKGAVR